MKIVRYFFFFLCFLFTILQKIWKKIIATAEDKEEEKDEKELAIAQLRRQKEEIEQQERDIRYIFYIILLFMDIFLYLCFRSGKKSVLGYKRRMEIIDD